MKTQLLTSLLMAATLGSSIQAHAKNIVVTSAEDNGRNSLREAVENAQDHDMILLQIPAGQQIELNNQPIHITKSIQIDGGSLKTVVNGMGSTNLFAVRGANLDVRFKNLNFVDGHSEKGGAIEVLAQDSNISVSNSNFVGNFAITGGAISVDNGKPHLEDLQHPHRNTVVISKTEFTKNMGSGGAAIFVKQGELFIDGSKFTNNSAKSTVIGGDGFRAHMVNSIAAYNSGTAMGGGALSIAFSTIYRNEAGIKTNVLRLSGSIVAENGIPGVEDYYANTGMKVQPALGDNYIGHFTTRVPGIWYETPTEYGSDDAQLVNLVPQVTSPAIGIVKDCGQHSIDINGKTRPAHNCTAGAIEVL